MSKQRNTRSSRSAAQHQTAVDQFRKEWARKPVTKIVTNKKAEQRRTMCRKGISDGAVFRFPTFS